ncbi:hypothetical protein ABZT47_29625 [Sphaerisporangium sp. NPDC005289]|uniref:hypothetical protein n=1 Tax=Sphaerisporangium sp. NPDC005289 TaxID=3155247 RepID=UPI0033BDB38C
MNRRPLLAVLGWVVVAGLTTVISTWAVSLLGEGLSDRVVSPVSRADVARALATATAAPRWSATPGGTPPARARAFTTDGGSVVAACDGGRAVLLSWSPAQGYAVDDVTAGPAATASLEFESDTRTVKVSVACKGDIPEMSVTQERESD